MRRGLSAFYLSITHIVTVNMYELKLTMCEIVANLSCAMLSNKYIQQIAMFINADHRQKWNTIRVLPSKERKVTPLLHFKHHLATRHAV